MPKLPQDNITLRCSNCEKRAGWIAVFCNLALAVIKLIVGVLSGSKAVIGDALYSFKDFFTALVVLVGIRISGRPADENHPYGYGKIEFVAIFLVSLLIIGGAFVLFIHAAKEIWRAFRDVTEPHPGFIAFWGAVISALANYKLSGYLHCVGERMKSPAMLANARHNHSDAIASGFVAVAVLLSRFGWPIADPLAAAIETVDLILLCISMMKDALRSLFDSSLEGDLVRQIESTVQLVPGVRKVASLKARRNGQAVWVDMVIRIDHGQTIHAGYRISRQIEETLKKRMEIIGDVHIEVEPYLPS